MVECISLKSVICVLPLPRSTHFSTVSLLCVSIIMSHVSCFLCKMSHTDVRDLHTQLIECIEQLYQREQELEDTQGVVQSLEESLVGIKQQMTGLYYDYAARSEVYDAQLLQQKKGMGYILSGGDVVVVFVVVCCWFGCVVPLWCFSFSFCCSYVWCQEFVFRDVDHTSYVINMNYYF